MESLYPWYQIAWDISVEEGMTDFETCSGFKQQIADELCSDILSRKIECWTQDYTPIRKIITIEELRKNTPHLTVIVANDWLKSRNYLYQWSPVLEPKTGQQAVIDFSKLATAEQLIRVFGTATGMNKTWFNGNYSKKLDDSRVLKGVAGNSPIPAYYCPMKVLMWLTSEKRGERLSNKNGWSLLERHFPKVYEEHSSADPR